MIHVIKVYSDNYDGICFTKDAYKELTLQMSTGDYHTHTAIDTLSPDYEGVVTLNDLLIESNEVLDDLING